MAPLNSLTPMLAYTNAKACITNHLVEIIQSIVKFKILTLVSSLSKGLSKSRILVVVELLQSKILR